MWCDKCERETDQKTCEICGQPTMSLSSSIFWCDDCKIPVFKKENEQDKHCPICGKQLWRMSSDIRPVFPEERLLLEILLDKPLAYIGASVWANDNRYYINGKKIEIANELWQETDADNVRSQLDKYNGKNNDTAFKYYSELFCQANVDRYNEIIDEAFRFIQKEAAEFPMERIVLSFSGGKDSTVTSDLAIRALSNPSLVHIFGNTTLELPTTMEYVERYRRNNHKAIFKSAKNKDQDFMTVCDDIGPPARLMRWCCSMFKTGPITRVINNFYRDQKILTFYGIRKNESVSRSKYNRVEDDTDTVKINQQKVASPIIEWLDSDIWLYLLTTKIDFNEAYRFGYVRVGCWCCPNNNDRSQFLAKIYMPKQYKMWHDFLIDFAKKIGKPDPEVYVDSGNWKARQGGQGLEAAKDVKIKYANCTTEENARIYRLTRKINEEFYELFIPLGIVSKELGRKLIHEVIVLDLKTKMPIISIQPFKQTEFDYAVKIKTLNVTDHESLHRMIGYQIKKYNVCRQCLKCESLCRYGAISIVGGEYHINKDKCHHCKLCVTDKFLENGCMIGKYLRIKDE